MKDLDNTFLNPDEYGEEHYFEGEEIMMVVTDIDTSETKLSPSFELAMENIYVTTKRLHFKDGVVSFPVEGDKVEFDGKNYIVASSSLEFGAVTVDIMANDS